MKTDLICTECFGTDVEVQLPGFYRVVDGALTHAEVDEGAEPLSFFCNTCETDVDVKGYDAGDPRRTTRGRWS